MQTTNSTCGSVGRVIWMITAPCVLWPLIAWAGPTGIEPGSADDFETSVRPVLAEHCYECHSDRSKTLKGGLRLDDLIAMRKGGDSGPAVVPGDVENSLLVRAIRYDDEALRMPPAGKLPERAIAALTRWVARGAIGPAGVSGSSDKVVPGQDFESAKRHWAYQPIRYPNVPANHHSDWPQSPIDCFVLARLEGGGLTPSPPADRRVLIRRAYLDLIGLPPTADEVEAFEQDKSPDAFARTVDRLLASPRYGERWGRHWLDVARFADTKDGVLMYGDDRVRPFAFTYRDYVIRAFNEDLGFDTMVRDQLAADVVAPRDQPWRLAAMGFLTLGRMFDNNIHDQIDDKIDTVTRGLLGLTVACARCHDHKYDAVPTADYYSLYGIFASSEAPIELPVIGGELEHSAAVEFEKQAAPKRRELREFLEAQHALLSAAARQQTPEYLVRAATTPPDPLETAIFFVSLAPEDLRPQIVARWRRYLRQRAKPDDAVFGPWHDLMALPDASWADRAEAVLARWRARPAGTASGQVNPLVITALCQSHPRSRAEVARAYGDLIRRVDEEARSKGMSAASKTGAVDAARQQIQAILADHESPAYFPRSQTYYFMSRGEKDAFGGKLVELDRMAVKAPHAPGRAMILCDAEEPLEPRIFVRGNPSQPGDRVPRQFLRVLAGANRRPFARGSGRLELAEAITAPDNPLTARVLVNRVWMHHFGEPLVSTPSDFGTRSTPPSHPDLLDYMAARFQRDGYSLKSLHRLIMLSNTYQQAGFDRPECRNADPENRLLWRFPRRRLDLEAMRDTLLFVSGRLDSSVGGRPVDVAGDPKNGRRTVYGLVDRQSLPAVFRAFDFASPDQSAERRPRTTVPQQALFSMNAPFVIEQAKALAARPEILAAPATEARIRALYRAVLTRPPAADEITAASKFLAFTDSTAESADHSRLSRWEQLAQVLLMTNELMFVD